MHVVRDDTVSDEYIRDVLSVAESIIIEDGLPYESYDKAQKVISNVADSRPEMITTSLYGLILDKASDEFFKVRLKYKKISGLF